MKKFISVFLSLVLICSMSATSFAAERQPNVISKTVKNEGYTFLISERTDEYNRIIRSYDNNNTSLCTAGVPDLDKTKALLVALGMQEKTVDNLNSEALQAFAEGKEIFIVNSYAMSDANNNVTYLSESIAVEAAKKLKAQQDKIKLSYALEGIPIAASSDYYSKYFQNSYIRVDYAVTYKGNGQYFYSVDSKWLTMPFFRGWDSLGACAMNGTVTIGSQSGYYYYDITYINGGIPSYASAFEWIDSSSEYGNAVNGNWYGSAAKFNLPNDVISSSGSIINNNFGAHFQYFGHVSSPGQTQWFNTVGSHTHSVVTINTSPNITIRTGASNLAASVGISPNWTSDIYGVEFEIKYTP